MAQKFQLNTEIREGVGTKIAKKLRREGLAPGVIYGGGQRTYPVQMAEKDIADLLKAAPSENVLVDLDVKGADTPKKLVLIQAVQRHTLNGSIIHVDFQTVREDREIKATLPLHLTGEALGVKAGGILEHQLHQLEVTCLPKHLPESLSFSAADLELGQALHIGDVEFPEGVRPNLGAGVVIGLIVEPRTAKTEQEEEDEAAASAGEGAGAPAESEG
ncbi:MAG: large subunit ribosomal protein L25 [Verrucomicrobiales bacterium]|jgi:large subunit ribosomal protein L25